MAQAIGAPAFKQEPHSFQPVKRLPYQVCTGCGLVRLRNPLTDWCVRYGCNHAEHPGFRAAVRALCCDTTTGDA